MSDELPLRSFEVEGFRAIRHLRLPELGQVNLIVGSNNAGKTSLLEAMRLYLYRLRRSLPLIILQIVRERTSYRPLFRAMEQGTEVSSADVEAAVQAMEALFHGSFENQPAQTIRIGPAGLGRDVLTLRLPWSDSPRGTGGDRPEPGGSGLLFAPESPLLKIESDVGAALVRLDGFLRGIPLLRTRDPGPVVIPATGLDSSRIRDFWDRVTVSGDDGRVEEAMRTIVPDLERVLVVGEADRRSILVRMRDVPTPVPLPSMGDGVNRVFGIALGIVLARDGVVLIDEVENGLHFTVQDQVWEAIFSLSRMLNVQVIATTHSWDTIVGFQYAANQSDAMGMLYRLDRKPDGLNRAIRYTEEELAIAAEQRIEVR